MPNLLFLAVSFLYSASLAIWIGGVVVLGALVAPGLFRTLDREVAGTAFGSILRRFLRLRIVAIAIAIGAAAFRFFAWEQGSLDSNLMIWIIMRWMCLAFMASVALYEITFLEKSLERALEARRRSGEDAGHEGDRFAVLHERSERLMKLTFVAALGALLVS